MRDVFSEPVGAYRAPEPRPGRRNRFSSRQRRSTAHEELLELLAGSVDHPPCSYRAAAQRLGLTSKQLSSKLYYLRHRLGVRVRGSAEQKLVSQITAPPRGRASERSEAVPLEMLEFRTALPFEVLRQRGLCGNPYTSHLPGRESIEVVRVATSALLFDAPHSERSEDQTKRCGRA